MRSPTRPPGRPWFVGRWGLPLLVVALAGCGPGQGEVSGRVTYKKAPVPGGWVTFRHADGRVNAVTVELDKDGNYPPVVLPTGDVSVVIDNRELASPDDTGDVILPGGVPLSPEAKKALTVKKKKKAEVPKRKGKAGSAKRSGRYVEIPEKYLTAETSGLKFKVVRGTQKKDFDLTD